MSGLIVDGLDLLVELLEDTGHTIVTNSAAIRPGVIVVDPPTLQVMNANLYELQFPVWSLAAPPADERAERKVLDMADDVIGVAPATAGGAPGIYSTGNQEIPGYRITVVMTVQR